MKMKQNKAQKTKGRGLSTTETDERRSTEIVAALKENRPRIAGMINRHTLALPWATASGFGVPSKFSTWTREGTTSSFSH